MPRWLILLSAYLLIWVPLNFALLAFQTLPSLAERGARAVTELAVHAAGALLCATAGWMLRVGNAAARRLTVAALVANAVLTVQAIHVSALPRDVRPGLALPLTLVTLAHAFVWIAYVTRSRRVSAWLAGE